MISLMVTLFSEKMLLTTKRICSFMSNWIKKYLTVSNAGKVEIVLEQSEVAFLSPSKICENLNFSREIQIFTNFAG